jgi:predicted kinase
VRCSAFGEQPSTGNARANTIRDQRQRDNPETLSKPGDRSVGDQAEQLGYTAHMPTVHLVCGYLGAGKTTFSQALAERESAVLFSLDELYLRLFADGPTYELDSKAMERLRVTLDELWPRVVKAGASVVLDCGFWRRTLRDRARDLARMAGATTRLHWLRCADDVALARCLERNGTAGAFLISPEGFQDLMVHFEPPQADESPEIVDTSPR